MVGETNENEAHDFLGAKAARIPTSVLADGTNRNAPIKTLDTQRMALIPQMIEQPLIINAHQKITSLASSQRAKERTERTNELGGRLERSNRCVAHPNSINTLKMCGAAKSPAGGAITGYME